MPSNRPSPRALHIGAMALILVVAAVARLFDLSLMEFRNDAAYWAIEGQRILHGGYWPLVGQQVGSVNISLKNGPLLSYLTAIVFGLGGTDPRHVAALIAAANVAGVWLTYRLGQRLYDTQVGLIAAATMAVAPWLVLYSRMLWPQSLLPLIVPLLFLVLDRAVEGQRNWLIACGALLGMAVQLHLSVLPFVGMSVLLILFYAGPRGVALLIAGGSIGYAPVLAHDTVTGLTTMRALVRLPALHAAADSFAMHAAKTAWNFCNVLSGQGMWVSKLAHRPYLPSPIDWSQSILFTALLLVALMAIARWPDGAASSGRMRGRRADVILITFVAAHVAYLLLAGSQINRHYFLVLYPLPFVLIARGLQLWRLHRPSRGRAFAAGLSVAMCLNLVTLVYAYRFLLESGGEGEYGTVLADKVAVVEHIAAQDSGYDVALGGVQEALPYAFLFGKRKPSSMTAVDTADVHFVSTGTNTSRTTFRLVEPAYHELTLAGGECVAFRSRGVVAVRPCTEGGR